MRRLWLLAVLAAIVLLVPVAVVISAPQAAWVKYAGNPVFRPSSDSSWDNRNVYAAKVLWDGSMYRMWYTGNGATSASPRIGYAWSNDAINWTRNPTPVLAPGSGWDGKGVSAPSVLYKDGVWHMWYAGKNVMRYSIGYATSPDGINWTKYEQNPVLTASAEGQADDVDTVSPHVLFKDGVYHMWYAGRGDTDQIFYATSPDGVQWTKYANNPVLRLGGDFDWDNGEIAAPSVLWSGAQFEMWYQGYSRGTLQHYIGHATSSDGYTWTKDALNPVVGLEAGVWDSYSVFYPSVIFGANGQPMMLYQGEASENQQKQLGWVAFDLNAVPTPRPTFPTESPIDLTLTPIVTPDGPPTMTPTPTATWTPVPVRCSSADDNHCVLLPTIRK
jgi:predicted GH43/DUF377 family glycosyl hydrolase